MASVGESQFTAPFRAELINYLLTDYLNRRNIRFTAGRTEPSRGGLPYDA